MLEKYDEKVWTFPPLPFLPLPLILLLLLKHYSPLWTLAFNTMFFHS
jgi:hypothetical protein